MSSDRVQGEVKNSSSLIPGNKSKQFSFLQPLYQERVETDSVRENKQRANPKQPLITHSFGRMSVRPIQAKLTIGQPNDKYEQEADRVASQVVQQISNPSTPQSTQGQSLQRMEKPEEEELQAKPMISVLQRMPEEEEELQTKPQISVLQRSLVSPVYQREAMLGEKALRAKSIVQRREVIGGGEASTDLDSAIRRKYRVRAI